MTDGTGLVNLRARYYDPGTGRFISKDTWIGDYNNPITLVKWMYANGNPIVYSDPSGRYSQSIQELNNIQYLKTRLENYWGYKLTSTDGSNNLSRTSGIENWDEPALLLLDEVSIMIGYRLYHSVDWDMILHQSVYKHTIPPTELFKALFGSVEIRRGPRSQTYVPGYNSIFGLTLRADNIYIAYGPSEIWQPGSQRGRAIILHEFGHLIDFRSNSKFTNDLLNCEKLQPLVKNIIKHEGPSEKYPNGHYAEKGWGTNSGLGVNMRSSDAYEEIWADLFASWVINKFPYNNSNEEANNGIVFKNYIVPYMQNTLTDLALQMNGGEV